MTLPFGRDANNLPLAFQLVGGFGADERLLANSRYIAKQLKLLAQYRGFSSTFHSMLYCSRAKSPSPALSSLSSGAKKVT